MKKLLSITDENAILITAEFIESGDLFKVGERSIQRYEIDLIIKNDITIDNLLLAIGAGLKNTLVTEYNYEETEDVSFSYADERYPDAETTQLTDDEIAVDALGVSSDKKRLGPIDRFRVKRALRKKRIVEQKAAAVSSAVYDTVNNSNEGKEETPSNIKDGYLICLGVFHVCYDAYLNSVQPSECCDSTTMPRRPVIGIGSIDYNRIPEGKLLCDSDFFQICLNKTDGSKTLKEAGFITTTRLVFDPIGWHRSAALFDPSQVTEAFSNKAPLYNISERPLRTLDSEAFHVISPSDIPQKNKQNIITTILTPLLMMGSMVGVRLLSGSGSASSGIMFGGMGVMGLVSAFTALINVKIRNSEHKKSVVEWKTQYESYIQRSITGIQKKQKEDVELLHELYPPAWNGEEDISAIDLVTKSISVDGDIFSRGKEHPDFLRVRIGISEEESELVPSVFEILGEKKESIYPSIKYRNIRNIPGYAFGIVLSDNDGIIDNEDGTNGYLIDLPYDIAKAYRYLNGAPVMLSLLECRSLGIVFDRGIDFQPFLSNMILNLCFYHSPDDLQIVMLCEEEDDWKRKQQIIRRYKHLPHFRELLGDLSPFAFSRDDASLIFNKLLEIMTERKAKESDGKYPHIIVIAIEEEKYELKSHPISEYLPSFGEKDSGYGMSFVFCKRYQEELPKFCEFIIKQKINADNERECFLFPHTQTISSSLVGRHSDDARYRFSPDPLAPDYKDMGNQEFNDTYYRAYKAISALYYKRIAQGANVPERVELLDIIGGSQSANPNNITEDLKLFINKSWSVADNETQIANRAISSLAVPLGKSSNGLTELDLHEKYDGPHMLVAGTTGSGKTETVLTYLISLCALYNPEQVNLLLVDMKGAGFVDRIGNPNGQGKGKLLPHVVGTVTNIAGAEEGAGAEYMLKRFLHSMNAEVKRRELLLHKAGVDSVDEYMRLRDRIPARERLEPLPHLFLVIDEYSELMHFTSENDDVDFRKAVTSLARIGRSLGFHIILISQNIENAITPDIRVNSKARLCLKVATKDASREMIGTDLAASPLMPGNGRAYLLIGTGSKFEYFQSGYSGASITRHTEAPIVITHAKVGGKYSLFYNSENNNNDFSSVCADNGPDNGAESQSDENNQSVTQLELLADCINECFTNSTFDQPHRVFQQPLPNVCYFDYDWHTCEGKCKVLEDFSGGKE